MAILSTGPIENSPISGVRPTQQVTVKMDNNDSVNSSTVFIQGYFLNGTRTKYVHEVLTLSPNEVETRNYFANFDAFEFVFTTSGPAEESTEISVWGKNTSGQLVTAHRLVSDELLGSEVAGPQGQCLIGTHTVAGSGENLAGNIPYRFSIGPSAVNEPLFRDFTSNHNKTLLHLLYPFFAQVQPAFLDITINIRGSDTPITDRLFPGFARVYQVEDFESLTVSNPAASFAEFEVFIQKTFCICCNET